MPNCAIVNCKNTSRVVGRKKGGVSFHRFPVDPHLKEKWIDATGTKNWFPTKHSTICSIHFDKGSFVGTERNRHLIKTAYPSIQVLTMKTDNKVDINRQPTSHRTSILIELEKIKEPYTSDETPLFNTQKEESITKEEYIDEDRNTQKKEDIDKDRNTQKKEEIIIKQEYGDEKDRNTQKIEEIIIKQEYVDEDRNTQKKEDIDKDRSTQIKKLENDLNLTNQKIKRHILKIRSLREDSLLKTKKINTLMAWLEREKIVLVKEELAE